MTKLEYAEAIAQKVNGTVKTIEKNNGLIKTAVLLPGNFNVGALYYIDEHFDNDDPIEKVVEEAKKSIQNIPKIDTEIIQNWEKIKDNLTIHLCNEITNAEIFRSAKEYGFHDLIMIPYVHMSHDGSLQAKVTKAMLQEWKVNEEDVFVTAMENMEKDASMINLSTLFGFKESTLYVVSNKLIGAYGASRILTNKIKNLCKQKFPNGYIVFPSSVHECLVSSRTGLKMEDADDMVKSINATCVKPEERLSDNAYCFE